MFEIDPFIFTLSNGLRVVFQRRDVFVAHMAIMFKAGSRYEQEGEEGLAHFVEHTIFKGTKTRDSFAILTELDSVGGELNAYTNKEELCIHASFRKVHLPIACSLLGDIVQNPTFPESELKKEKEVIKDEINSYLDSPSERIFDEFEELLYPKHPLGYNILGTKKSVSALTRESTLNFVDKLFTADNAVISVVGDLDLDELKGLLEQHFATMPVSKAKTRFQDFNPEKVAHFDQIEANANYQAHVLIGGLAPVKKAADRRAMTLLMNYLGGPAMNARLVLLIREKYGYAYNIEANFTPYHETGFWTIYAGTDPKYLSKTKDLLLSELADITENGMSREDLSHAKEQLKGHVSLSLDSNLEIMFYAAKNLLFHERIDGISAVYKQIDAIQEEEIKALAQEIFDSTKISSLIYNLR